MNTTNVSIGPSVSRISALGAYVPKHRLTNADLERMVDTDDEWIVRRTGIRERRMAAPGEFTSHMSLAAVQDLRLTYGKSLEDVDLILVCTHTPDAAFPSTACLLQDALGIPHAGAVDLNATCAGFVYGLHLANAAIASGLHRKVLVVGADTMSRVVDYTDRTTCILFGDGAGAALVERASGESAFLAYHLGSEGRGGEHVYRSGLADTVAGKPMLNRGKVVQNGREVYKWAVTRVPEGTEALLRKAGLSPSQVDWFVPHSANLRMIEAICERSALPIERTLHSLELYGNTSAASIPLSLRLAAGDGRLRPGQIVLLYGFGGGLVHGGQLLRWLPDSTEIPAPMPV